MLSTVICFFVCMLIVSPCPSLLFHDIFVFHVCMFMCHSQASHPARRNGHPVHLTCKCPERACSLLLFGTKLSLVFLLNMFNFQTSISFLPFSCLCASNSCGQRFYVCRLSVRLHVCSYVCPSVPFL